MDVSRDRWTNDRGGDLADAESAGRCGPRVADGLGGDRGAQRETLCHAPGGNDVGETLRSVSPALRLAGRAELHPRVREWSGLGAPVSAAWGGLSAARRSALRFCVAQPAWNVRHPRLGLAEGRAARAPGGRYRARTRARCTAFWPAEHLRRGLGRLADEQGKKSMLIGAMNHPARDLAQQVTWLGENGFEFIDLTLEPPAAASWTIDPRQIRGMLEAAHLGVVGHTAPFLPIASPVEELRKAALFELRRCMDVLHGLGARWMNVHPGVSPMHGRGSTVERNLESLSELLEYGKDAGVGVMVENIPGSFNTVEQLSELLDPLPALGLHLDIGHANLMTPRNITEDVLAVYATRLRHVHLHDNRGGTHDLHLPLGAGEMDIAGGVRALQAVRYDGTITLEVFSGDCHYLLHSREVLRQMWAQSKAESSKPTAG